MAADNWCCKGLKDYSYQCVQSPQVGFHRWTKNVMPLQIVLLYVTCFFVTCQGTTPVSVTLYDTCFHILRHLFWNLCSVNSSVQYSWWMAEVTLIKLMDNLTKFCHIFMFCFITSSLLYIILCSAFFICSFTFKALAHMHTYT